MAQSEESYYISDTDRTADIHYRYTYTHFLCLTHAHTQMCTLVVCVCMCLLGSTAFLLGYVSRRNCPMCGDEGELVLVDDTAGPDHSVKTGGMYLGELRDMLKKYLQEEKIEDTVQ